MCHTALAARLCLAARSPAPAAQAASGWAAPGARRLWPAGAAGGAKAEAFLGQLRGNAPIENVVSTAKEAVAKALEAPAGLSWQDCEILIGERGKPYLELSGTVAAEAKRQGITNWHLSLSHDGNIATAFVIAEKQ